MDESSNPLHAVRRDRPTIQDIQLTEDGTKARFTVPGPSPDFLNGQGNPCLNKIGKLFECARVQSATNPDFIFRKIIGAANKTAFTVVMNMEIHRSLYQRARANKWVWPLDLTNTLTAFGNTSMDYMSIIEDRKDGTELGTLKFKYASVDLETRKAVQIPAEVKEAYRQHLKPTLAVRAYKPASRPVKAHCLTIRVQSSDIDQNLHVNNTVYLRLCEDCAAEACQERALKNFRGNFLLQEARSVQALYQSECLPGETVTVYCWEDSERTDTIHFEILKRDGKLSFCCQITYYPMAVSHL